MKRTALMLAVLLAVLAAFVMMEVAGAEERGKEDYESGWVHCEDRRRWHLIKYPASFFLTTPEDYRIERHFLYETYPCIYFGLAEPSWLWMSARVAETTGIWSAVVSDYLGYRVHLEVRAVADTGPHCGLRLPWNGCIQISGEGGADGEAKAVIYLQEREGKVNRLVAIHELAHLIDWHKFSFAGYEAGHGFTFKLFLARLYLQMMGADMRPYCKLHGEDCDWSTPWHAH